MDFFEHQDRARTNTTWLLFYFALAVVGTIVALYAVTMAVFIASEGGSGFAGEFRPVDAWNPVILFWVTVIAGGLIGAGSATRIAQLSAGGSVVAEALGGRKISTRPNDINELKLWNVVEEMSIASGVPVPELYVMEQEAGINAFAAGHSPSDAAIGVTKGCIEQLSRDELQGVIAHEFSHILNGDMRLNTRLIGILAGIVGLAVIGRFAFEIGLRLNMGSRGGNDKNSLPIPLALILIGLAVIAIGYIGLLCGRLIQAAISRQREFLADASAVQFTRNPDGLLGAFKLIALGGSRINSPEAEEASHMFFANGLSAAWMHAFATHPPLPLRMNRIDNTGRAVKELQAELAKRQHYQSEDKGSQFGDETMGFAGASSSATSPTSSSTSSALPPVPGQTGQTRLPPIPGKTRIATGADSILEPVSDNHLAHATKLRDGIPPELLDAAHDTISAAALVYALLLDHEDESVRDTQLASIGSLHPGIKEETLRLFPHLAGLEARACLPLLDLAIPALRGLSRKQYDTFRTRLDELTQADDVIDLGEYALLRCVRRHLDVHFGLVKPSKVAYRHLYEVMNETLVALSILAHLGSNDQDEVERAFIRGTNQLYGFQDIEPDLLPVSECGLEALDSALDKLAQAAPLVKKTVLYASAVVVMTDNVVNDIEAELLRAIADALETPLPPLVGERL